MKTSIAKDSTAYKVLVFVKENPESNAKKIMEACQCGPGFAEAGWVKVDKSRRPMVFSLTAAGLEAIAAIEENGDKWFRVNDFEIPVKSKFPQFAQEFINFLKEIAANPGESATSYESYWTLHGHKASEIFSAFKPGFFTVWDLCVGGPVCKKGIEFGNPYYGFFKFDDNYNMSLTEKSQEILKTLEIMELAS